MSNTSDDPRDAIATRETQQSDQNVRRDQRKQEDRRPAEVRTLDDDLEGADREEDERLSESRPTPGSAEGERDVREQSESSVPKKP